MSDYLSEDLIAEIFERLPVKTLLRFRSLSKSWCSHISSTDFIRKHALRSAKNAQKVLIRNMYSRKDVFTLHSEDQLPLCLRSGYQGTTAVEIPCPLFDIEGSCNGILCLIDEDNFISLWNYSIQRRYEVPVHPFHLKTSKDTRIIIGFGFDPIISDYKVVVITYSIKGGAAHDAAVYSLQVDSWTEVASPTTPFYEVTSDACFVNGTLHWVVRSKEETTPHHFIMTFDLSTHVFGTISLPEPYWTTNVLSMINASLAIVSSKADDTWIWVRKESTNVSLWSVAFKLKTDTFDVGKILQPTPNGNLVICYPEYDPCEIYNPRTGVHSRLVKITKRCSDVMMETMYVESLELLDRIRAFEYGKVIRLWTK